MRLKLERISVENFKSLKLFQLDFRSNITLLIGANATGKSNTIDALSFVRDWIVEGLNQALGKRGNYEKTVSFGDVSEPILMKLSFQDLDSKETVNYQLRVASERVVEEIIETSQQSLPIVYKDNTANVKVNGTHGVHLANLQGLPWNLIRELKSPVVEAIRKSFERCYHSSAFRLYQSSYSIRGRPYPDERGTDLALQVHQFLTGSRDMFQRYEDYIKQILPSIKEINSPILPGSDQATVSVTFEDLDHPFSLEQLSSGTQEVLFMVLTIIGSPPNSLVLLEEPENHLHAEAQRALIELIKEISESQDKQFMITSHSEVILSQLMDLSDVVFISMKDYKTMAQHMDELEDITVIWDSLGIDRAKLGYVLGRGGNVIVIMEGRTDLKAFEPLWDFYRLRDKVLPVRADGGSWEEIIENAAALKQALSRFRFSSKVFVLLDADSDYDAKVNLLKGSGFSETEFYVWPDKEIEEYLLIPRALAEISGKTEDEVEITLQRVKGRGKERFDLVLRKLDIDDLGPKTLMTKAIALEEIPKEFIDIIDKIEGLLGWQHMATGHNKIKSS